MRRAHRHRGSCGGSPWRSRSASRVPAGVGSCAWRRGFCRRLPARRSGYAVCVDYSFRPSRQRDDYCWRGIDQAGFRKPMNTDIVITGMGAVTPIGATVESFWQSNLDGKSGLALETQMDLSGLPCGWVLGTIPGEVKESIVKRWGGPGRSMGDSLMREAVEQSLTDAQFKEPLARRG